MIEGQSDELGDEHPHTLESMHRLAVLYKEQEVYDETVPLLLEAVKGRLLKLGDNHSHTIESRDNLIKLYEAWLINRVTQMP